MALDPWPLKQRTAGRQLIHLDDQRHRAVWIFGGASAIGVDRRKVGPCPDSKGGLRTADKTCASVEGKPLAEPGSVICPGKKDGGLMIRQSEKQGTCGSRQR